MHLLPATAANRLGAEVETDFANRGSWGFLSWEFRDTYTWPGTIRFRVEGSERYMLAHVGKAFYFGLVSIVVSSGVVIRCIYGGC